MKRTFEEIFIKIIFFEQRKYVSNPLRSHEFSSSLKSWGSTFNLKYSFHLKSDGLHHPTKYEIMNFSKIFSCPIKYDMIKSLVGEWTVNSSMMEGFSHQKKKLPNMPYEKKYPPISSMLRSIPSFHCY